MGVDKFCKFWITDEQMHKIISLAHLENEKEIKQIFKDIKKLQRIKK